MAVRPYVLISVILPRGRYSLLLAILHSLSASTPRKRIIVEIYRQKKGKAMSYFTARIEMRLLGKSGTPATD